MTTENGTRKRAILFDSTRCIGCGACYSVCKEKNQLPLTSNNFLRDTLSADTYTVVNRRNGRFIRRMCMHCEDPTCVSVCPVGALTKTTEGPVFYESSKCLGCRYCMQACPFNVPRYEWDKVVPCVSKCDMCVGRGDKGPMCAEVCPEGATVWGTREELLAEAHRRIAESPDTYLDHVY